MATKTHHIYCCPFLNTWLPPHLIIVQSNGRIWSFTVSFNVSGLFFTVIFLTSSLFYLYFYLSVFVSPPFCFSPLYLFLYFFFFNTLKTLTCQRLMQWWENEWMTIASRKLSKMVYYESIDGTFSVMLSDQIWIWLNHDNPLYLTLTRCISRMLSTFFFLKKILSFVECSPVSPFCSFLPLSLFSLFLPLAYPSPWPFQLLIIHWMLSTMTCGSLILPSAFTDTYIQGCDKRT